MIKEKITNLIEQTIKDLAKKGRFPQKLPQVTVEVSKEEKWGDYSSNIALGIQGRDKEKVNSREIAELIVTNLPKTDFLEKVKVGGAGFINFTLNKKWVTNQVSEIIKQGEKFGSSNFGQGKKMQVEFISANPTGPLTLGNGRGGFFGDILAKVLEKAGHKVEREYYINDVGGQIEALGKSILAEQGKIKWQEGFYKGNYIKDLARRFAARQAKKIKDEDPTKFGEKASQIILKEIKDSIKNLNIKFDFWFSEKSLQEGSEVEKTIEKLKKKNLTYQKEGALWFKATKLGDSQDYVLKKSDGQFTYFASDIAYHLNKFEKRKFQKVINIWGADHAGHVSKLKLAMKVFGYDDELDIIICQLVRLIEKGKEIKMSKRLGTYVTLDELIDEVGKDVARFFFVMKAPDTHMDFDLELAREHSQKNPVFYVQYAYARIHSLLKKAQSPELRAQSLKLDLLTHPAEISLIKELLKFPEIIEDIAKNYHIQELPYYSIALAQKFHNFYEKCRVLSDKRQATSNKELSQARLALVEATKIVLKNTFDLLGISAPEKM